MYKAEIPDEEILLTYIESEIEKHGEVEITIDMWEEYNNCLTAVKVELSREDGIFTFTSKDGESFSACIPDISYGEK